MQYWSVAVPLRSENEHTRFSKHLPLQAVTVPHVLFTSYVCPGHLAARITGFHTLPDGRAPHVLYRKHA